MVKTLYNPLGNRSQPNGLDGYTLPLKTGHDMDHQKSV